MNRVTHWSRALLFWNASTPTIPSGMRQNRPAEVTVHVQLTELQPLFRSFIQTNLTRLACFTAVCSGEISDSDGVVLSPNWPEAYDKGQDCIWGLHVDEDKRIMLDVQV